MEPYNFSISWDNDDGFFIPLVAWMALILLLAVVIATCYRCWKERAGSIGELEPAFPAGPTHEPMRQMCYAVLGEPHVKPSTSRTSARGLEPGAYPGSQQYRSQAAPQGYGYSGGFNANSPVSSLDGASPFGSASYGYPSFSQFGSGSYGGYPGSNVGFAPSSFSQFGSMQGAEQLAAASQQAYQTAPSSYGSAISTPYASKGYSGQGQSYQ